MPAIYKMTSKLSFLITFLILGDLINTRSKILVKAPGMTLACNTILRRNWGNIFPFLFSKSPSCFVACMSFLSYMCFYMMVVIVHSFQIYTLTTLLLFPPQAPMLPSLPLPGSIVQCSHCCPHLNSLFIKDRKTMSKIFPHYHAMQLQNAVL